MPALEDSRVLCNEWMFSSENFRLSSYNFRTRNRELNTKSSLAAWAPFLSLLIGYNESLDQTRRTRLLTYGQLKLGEMNPTPECISSLYDLIVP